MESTPLGIDDLRKQLDEIGADYHRLSDEDRFTVWFLRAYLTEDLSEASASLCNGPRDKGLDAVYIDHKCKAVFLVQAKYRQTLGTKTESRNDIVSFAELGRLFEAANRQDFLDFTQDMDEQAKRLLQEAQRQITKHSFRLELCYVTLGNVSSALQKEAQKIIRQAACEVYWTLLDAGKSMSLLRDYLDGVAPPIPSLDLEFEKGNGVSVNGTMQRYEKGADIETWVFSMRGDAIAELYDFAGVRLFARNVRGFLGSNTLVNRTMKTTLEVEPDRFFYYNNGITILCEDAKKESAKGRDLLRVSNPQVINGQQTTRSLAQAGKDAARASVLVKVLKVPRQLKADGFDALVGNVVAGTNRQNAVSAADLMANDRIQIELERELRKRGYLYMRKRENKSEAKARAGGRHYILVKNRDLAVAVAGCQFDPVVARLGRDKLFEESRYSDVFPNSDPNYYLPRYWLMWVVGQSSKGKPERGYAKWLVLGFVWSHLQSEVRAEKSATAFSEAFEYKDSNADSVYFALLSAVDKVFLAAMRYYRANCGKGESRVDISTFFRKAGHDKAFRKFWATNGSNDAKGFAVAWEKFRAQLEAWKAT